MSKNDQELYEGIVRILQARPETPIRVIVVDAGGGQPAVLTDTERPLPPAVSGSEDRVFGVKWNVQGHGVIAKVAVEDILKDEAPAAYAKLKLFLEEDPEGRDDIIKMAQWPDRIKPPARGDEFKKWEALGQAHRKDHYVNYELDHENPSSNPQEIGVGKLLTALKEWTEKLANETDPTERGHALAFVTHLIGDIHQPLHCSALVGKYFPLDEFPEGDQGGNLVWWAGTRTFHSLWDGLLVKSAAEFDDVYAELRSGLDRNDYAARLDRKTFHAWARESYDISAKAYEKFFATSEHIGRSTRTDDDGTEKEGQLFEAPTQGYRKWARSIAFDQGRIAAFRLADALREAFA